MEQQPFDESKFRELIDYYDQTRFDYHIAWLAGRTRLFILVSTITRPANMPRPYQTPTGCSPIWLEFSPANECSMQAVGKAVVACGWPGIAKPPS